MSSCFHGFLGGALLLWAGLAEGALYRTPTPAFTELLNAIHVPARAQRLKARPVATGLWERCREWLRPGSTQEAKTIEEAVALLDRYAENLIATYPLSVQGTLREGYFNHRGVNHGDESMPSHGMYDINAPREEVYITAAVLDRSQVFLRILLIHEVVIHQGQHLQMLERWGRPRLNEFMEEFRRATELTAYLMEHELAQLIAPQVLAQDLEHVAIPDEYLGDILESWGNYRSESVEDRLKRIYGSYFFSNSTTLLSESAFSLLPQMLSEAHWDRTLRRRPFAEIAAVTARWRK
jgi:hypothetical protein